MNDIEPSKKAIFKEALKDLKRHFRPSKQIILIFSIIFSIVFVISMIRIVISNQGILFYMELNVLFSSIIGILTLITLVVIDTIRQLHFTYHSSRLGKIKHRLREKNK